MQPKQFLLFALLSVTYNHVYCQEPQNTKVYEIRNTIAVYPCDITGKHLYQDNQFSTPPFGSKFIFVKPSNTNNNTVIIKYLLWNKKKDSALRKYYNDPLIKSNHNTGNRWDAGDAAVNRTEASPSWNSADSNSTARRSSDTSTTSPQSETYTDKTDRLFMIQRYDLDSNCVKVYNTGIKSTVFTIGLVTMPLKLRLGENFDFQGNLSLGSTAGAKMRLSKYSSNYINFLTGASISTITLDSFSTNGKITGQPLTNIAVFSPSLGVVFEFGKAQAGVFYGWDFLNKSTQLKYSWIFNKKPWISVGFGFSIFNINSDSNNSQSQTQ